MFTILPKQNPVMFVLKRFLDCILTDVGFWFWGLGWEARAYRTLKIELVADPEKSLYATG